jgi:UTP-glucose-1-phosphate uridylyltransferase
VLAVERVPMEDVSSYGVIAPMPATMGDGVYRCATSSRKPPRDDAPSTSPSSAATC